MAQRERTFRVTGFIREVAPSICVHRGEMSDGSSAYIKECRSQDVGNATDVLLSEATRLSAMKGANVVDRYSIKLSQLGDQTIFQLVLEWMDRSLEKEISMRTKDWDEEELLEALRVLVEALAKGEELKFAHRNLNPRTIFLTAEKQLKIGDFSCSMLLPCRNQFPMDARYNHMAPEVQQIYIRIKQTEQLIPSMYDVFRADVYSLGLILLQMAKRGPFSNNPLHDIEFLPYSSDLCGFLRLMLHTTPHFRPNFKLLRKTIYEVRPGLYRPSSRSTADAEPLLSSRISDLLEMKITFKDLWARELNEKEKMEESLNKLMAFGNTVRAAVTIWLQCHRCQVTYQVDVLGVFEAEHLLFCKECLA